MQSSEEIGPKLCGFMMMPIIRFGRYSIRFTVDSLFCVIIIIVLLVSYMHIQ